MMLILNFIQSQVEEEHVGAQLLLKSNVSHSWFISDFKASIVVLFLL